MKKRFYFLVVFLVLLLMYACYLFIQNNSYQADVLGKAEDISLIDNLEFSVKTDTLTRTSIVVIIKNISGIEYETTDKFSIEKEVDGEWMQLKLKDSGVWLNLSSTIIKNNSEVEFTCDWKDIYGKLKKGTYRLVKEINSKRIAVEFKI